jgi:hypothetical protein
MPTYLAIAIALRDTAPMTAHKLATYMGVRINTQYSSRAWYAHVKACAKAGMIVAAVGAEHYGQTSTTYTAFTL